MTPATVRKYYVVTLRGERGPLDRGELVALVRDGEVQRSDRVRTATGRQLGTVAEVLSDGRARETSELMPPTMAPEANPVALKRVSGRQRSSSTPRPAQPPWMWIAVAGAGVILVGVLWAMAGVTPEAVPNPPESTPETPTPAVTEDGKAPHPGGGMVAVGGDLPDSLTHPRSEATVPLTMPAPPPPPPEAVAADPATWTAVDIGGDLTGKGPTRTPNGAWTMTAGGADIYDCRDQCRLAAATMSGDFTITACVTAMQATHRFDKAGLMFRTDDSPGSAMLMVNVSHAGQMQGIVRNFAGTNSRCYFDESTSHAFPVWLRLSRHAGVITPSTSPDGKAWQARGAFTVPSLQSPVLCGITLCSHHAGVLTTAVFDQIAITTP